MSRRADPETPMADDIVIWCEPDGTYRIVGGGPPPTVVGRHEWRSALAEAQVRAHLGKPIWARHPDGTTHRI